MATALSGSMQNFQKLWNSTSILQLANKGAFSSPEIFQAPEDAGLSEGGRCSGMLEINLFYLLFIL